MLYGVLLLLMTSKESDLIKFSVKFFRLQNFTNYYSADHLGTHCVSAAQKSKKTELIAYPRELTVKERVKIINQGVALVGNN